MEPEIVWLVPSNVTVPDCFLKSPLFTHAPLTVTAKSFALTSSVELYILISPPILSAEPRA